jgi:drug/metabolite transporter (DMT)-like permease
VTETTSKFRAQMILAFGLVYVLWGSTYLAIRIAVEHIPPLMMGAVRFIIAGVLMLGWRAFSGHPIKVKPRELLRLVVIGVLLLTTGNVVLGWAETLIPTGLAALLIAITPLWFLLLEHFSRRGDHLSWRGIVGIALGLLGVVVLLWPDITGAVHVGRRELLGAALVMCSSFSWACGSVFSKRWHLAVDPYTASGWEMFAAGCVNLILALLVGDEHRTVWASSSVGAIVYLVIAGSMIGFTAYVWLLQNVPTPKVATYAYVNPIVAVFLGWLVLHEKITPFIIGGSVVVVLSVYIVTGAEAHTAPPEEVEEFPAVESAGD